MELREAVAQVLGEMLIASTQDLFAPGNFLKHILALCQADTVRREREAFVAGAKWQSYRMGDEVRMMEEAKAMYGDE